MREVDQLLDTPPDKLPQDSRYLLELDYSTLYNVLFECQSYWVLAMKAARRAGQRSTALRQRLVVPHRRCIALCQPPLLWLDVTQDKVEPQHKLGLSTVMRCRPHPDSNGVGCSSNKRLQNPD
jgi:hypothetical protein